ncbi:MAG TPA: DUF3592 domain-containing protein [Ktedonobacterales bacterium]|jgi:hypothetical protein
MIGSNPFAARATRRGRSPAKIVGLIFLGLALIPLAIGLFFLVDTLHFLGSASASATGSIVACQYPKSSSSACMPTIAFTTARGEQITFSEPFASSGFAVGQPQPVAYSPDNPQDARVATFLTLWFLPTLLLSLGGLFLLIGGIGSAIGFWRRQAPSG